MLELKNTNKINEISIERRASLKIEIDDNAGFCFGVVNAISTAERELKNVRLEAFASRGSR